MVYELHIHSQPIKIKCGTPLERQKMHYIPKYSRDRQNKRQSQKFVTVLDDKQMIKLNPLELSQVMGSLTNRGNALT